jgi:hypothetical protein
VTTTTWICFTVDHACRFTIGDQKNAAPSCRMIHKLRARSQIASNVRCLGLFLHLGSALIFSGLQPKISVVKGYTLVSTGGILAVHNVSQIQDHGTQFTFAHDASETPLLSVTDPAASRSSPAIVVSAAAGADGVISVFESLLPYKRPEVWNNDIGWIRNAG